MCQAEKYKYKYDVIMKKFLNYNNEIKFKRTGI